MQSAKTARQLIEFQQCLFNGVYDSAVLFQDQVAKYNGIMGQKMGFSPEVHDTISQWQGALKQQRDDLKKMIDNGFAQWTALFTPPYVKPAPVAQKTTPKKAEAKPETA